MGYFGDVVFEVFNFGLFDDDWEKRQVEKRIRSSKR